MRCDYLERLVHASRRTCHPLTTGGFRSRSPTGAAGAYHVGHSRGQAGAVAGGTCAQAGSSSSGGTAGIGTHTDGCEACLGRGLFVRMHKLVPHGKSQNDTGGVLVTE